MLKYINDVHVLRCFKGKSVFSIIFLLYVHGVVKLLVWSILRFVAMLEKTFLY